MSAVDAVLYRLNKVRRTGRGRWLACCPAHADTNPSLSIRELDDGRILIHDFGGCEVASVLSVLSLTFADLMPDRALGDRLPRERTPFSAIDILSAMAGEALFVAVAASEMAGGASPSPVSRARLWKAATRLRAAVEVANGHR